MRENLSCFLDFYLVGMEKNLKAEKTKREMKSPKKETAEKNKKTKEKEKKHTKGARQTLNLVIEMRF
jgi:hypothetical protein